MAEIPDEAAPVRQTWSDFLQRCNMLRGSVPLVACKPVFRILLVQLDQLTVTSDLGYNACGRDGIGGGIAFDDWYFLTIQAKPGDCIDQKNICRHLCSSLAHGLFPLA